MCISQVDRQTLLGNQCKPSLYPCSPMLSFCAIDASSAHLQRPRCRFCSCCTGRVAVVRRQNHSSTKKYLPTRPCLAPAYSHSGQQLHFVTPAEAGLAPRQVSPPPPPLLFLLAGNQSCIPPLTPLPLRLLLLIAGPSTAEQGSAAEECLSRFSSNPGFFFGTLNFISFSCI